MAAIVSDPIPTTNGNNGKANPGALASSLPADTTSGHIDAATHHHHEHAHEGDPNGGSLFQINVKLPRDPYEMTLAVTSQEQVQDVRQSIVESPGTFQYTCFHLDYNDERINDFVELSEVKGLEAGSELVLVEDPYTEKEARMHVIRIRELIGAARDRVDQLHGICAGMPLHDTIVAAQKATDGESTAPEHALVGFEIEATASTQCIVPQQPEILPRTVKSLSVSAWNPPPHHLRLRGHLLYLQVTTNEGEQFQITSTVSGFFVSRSSSNKFDPFPRPAPKNHHAHSLLSLFSLVSPSFDKAFAELQESNNQNDPLTTFPFQNAISANPWLVSPTSSLSVQHHPDQTRAQEAYLVGGADNIETLRDWNEEFQTTRELPRETVQDRVFRERLTSKLFADYSDAATRGAVLVARGEVAALNPTEASDAQIFVYNNIFFSFGADGVETFANDGGDEAARVAVGKDIIGVKAVNQLDILDLYTPGTIVVDYLGKRIVGQSIVPGIFKQREPGEPQIDYGGVEGKDVVAQNAAFTSIFEKLSSAVYVKRHAVWDKEGTRHDLEGSIETKGLLGTDARKYVLDLYRITPLDVIWADEAKSTEDARYGQYPHRMTTLRLELVEAYRRMKLQQYVKVEVDRRMKEPKVQTTSPPIEQGSAGGGVLGDGEVAETKAILNGQVDQHQDREGPLEQELVDLSQFIFSLNPDVCSGQIPQTDEEKEEYSQDEAEVRAVCMHLRTKIIPELIRDLHENDVGYPMDGKSLCQLLHKRGINLRYLGLIARHNTDKGNRLKALCTLAVQEMVVRAFKHITNQYLYPLPSVFAASCISHLLNCFFSTQLHDSPQAETDEELKQSYPGADMSFETVTPRSLTAEIEEQVSIRYRYHLPSGWLTDIKPLQVLREISLRLGLQLAAEDYDFGKVACKAVDHPMDRNGATGNGRSPDEQKKKKKRGGEVTLTNGVSSKSASIFTPNSILNIIPIVKDAAPRSALAEEALEAGRISLQQNQKQLGQELLLESLSLHEQIYGILHPEVAKMYHQLSMIYFQTDEKEAAVELARKAVIVTERTLGVDSTDTILAYLNLSLFEHSLGNTKIALTYVKHALSLWKIIYGPCHPDSITTMNNAAVMLQTLRHYTDSRRWFEASLSVCEDLFGRHSINVATILFQLAQALALDHDSKSAVHCMREAYTIFHSELGSEDRNTKEAENWLEQLTQNAVSIAKHAKDVQNRRLRRLQITPSISLRTRPQPQVGGRVGGPAADTTSSGSRPTALDSRSVDELLKFIEGSDTKSSPQAKHKKRAHTVNPRMRSVSKEAVVG